MTMEGSNAGLGEVKLWIRFGVKDGVFVWPRRESVYIVA